MSTVCDVYGTTVHLSRKLRFDSVNEFDAEFPYPTQEGPNKSSAFTFRARLAIDTGLNSSPLFNMIAHITHKPNDPFVSFRFFRPTHANGMTPELKDGFANVTMTMMFVGQDGQEKFTRSYTTTMDYCGRNCSCKRDGSDSLCHRLQSFCPVELILDSVWKNNLTSGKAFAYLFAFFDIRLTGRVNSNSNSNAMSLEPMSTFSLSRSMKKILETSTLYDVILKVGGQEFQAHMSILAGHSDVFEAMFDSDMKERNSKVVEINDLTPSTVSILLKYLYYRELREIQENPQIAVDLLRAADKYNIKDLQQTCEEIIQTTSPDIVNLSTALDCYLIAHRISLPTVERRAIQVLKSKRKEIPNSDCFKKFLETNIDVLPSLFYLLTIEDQ